MDEYGFDYAAENIFSQPYSPRNIFINNAGLVLILLPHTYKLRRVRFKLLIGPL